MRAALGVLLVLLLLIPAVTAQDIHTVAPGESLMHVSRQVNICVEALLDANPDLTPRSIYDMHTGDEIVLPADAPACYDGGATTFEYVVEEYDTLYGLSYFYGVPVSTVIEANPTAIQNPNLIEIGQVINVPISSDTRIDYTYFPFDVTGTYATYLESESLRDFADRMGFDLEELARLNDLPLDAQLDRGQPISAVKTIEYRVRTEDVPETYADTYLTNWGDTLLGLAIQYETSFERLIDINKVSNPDGLGQKRVIFIPAQNADTTEWVISDSRQYTVRWGDSLHDIARRYHTLPQLIALVNNLKDPGQIDVGDTVMIPAYIRTSSGILQTAALLVFLPFLVLFTSRRAPKRKGKPKEKHG